MSSRTSSAATRSASRFARHPHAFPALIVAMVAAGESGGILDEVLERIALMLERDHALRKSVIDGPRVSGDGRLPPRWR